MRPVIPPVIHDDRQLPPALEPEEIDTRRFRHERRRPHDEASLRPAWR
jgi:hypothetical protein